MRVKEGQKTVLGSKLFAFHQTSQVSVAINDILLLILQEVSDARVVSSHLLVVADGEVGEIGGEQLEIEPLSTY